MLREAVSSASELGDPTAGLQWYGLLKRWNRAKSGDSRRIKSTLQYRLSAAYHQGSTRAF
jgi:hypothetical protein